jgi:hypothetical protein
MPVKSSNSTFVRLLAVCTLLAAGSALAHHSPAMFDRGKNITLVGEVKEFQWISPHCWIQLLVPDASNPDVEPVEWSIEMDNPLGLMRHGWKPGSLKPGDQVTVVAHPLRDGSHGAEVVSVQTADGEFIGTGDIGAKQLR